MISTATLSIQRAVVSDSGIENPSFFVFDQ